MQTKSQCLSCRMELVSNMLQVARFGGSADDRCLSSIRPAPLMCCTKDIKQCSIWQHCAVVSCIVVHVYTAVVHSGTKQGSSLVCTTGFVSFTNGLIVDIDTPVEGFLFSSLAMNQFRLQCLYNSMVCLLLLLPF